MFTQYLFKHFRYYRENTNWSIVLFLVSGASFENWDNISLLQQRRKLWLFNCFNKEHVKIFGKTNLRFNVRILGNSFVFKFHNLIKNIFFPTMIKSKYLFGKAWFIAAIILLTIAFNAGWDMLSESSSIYCQILEFWETWLLLQNNYWKCQLFMIRFVF